MGRMRTLREAVVILLAVALVGLAAHGLALAAADRAGGLAGWGPVAAMAVAGVATLLALVSSTLAARVVRSRAWLLGLGALTALALGAVGLTWASRGSEPALGALAYATALGLALWVPVGARWWLEELTHEPARAELAADHAAHDLPDDGGPTTQAAAGSRTPQRPAVSRRAALVAGGTCTAVVLLVAILVLGLAGGSVPSALVGSALVLVLAAAAASGRVQDTVALALLAGVGLCAVLFRVLELPEGRLVVGALALVVLVAFAWRPFAVRLTAARSAVVPAPVDRTEP